MRFRHLTLDEQLKKTEKSDEKTVAKAHLLQSKAWKDHIAEHHGAGDKAQLLLIETEDDDDSELLKKATDKKEQEPKEAQAPPTHTVEHGQAAAGATGSRTSYLSNAGGGATPSGAGDTYFGAGSARLKAISGQCSCGMEITIGWQPEQPAAPALQTSYSTGLKQETKNQETTPLYQTGLTANNPFAPDQKPMYTAAPSKATSLFDTDADQKRRKASAL